MSNCPVEGCQISQEHHKALFGENGVKKQLEIIRLKMTKFVTRKSIWVTFISGLFLFAIIGGFLLNLWADIRENAKTIPNIVEKVDKHEERIIRTEEKILSFKANQTIQINLLNEVLQTVKKEK